MYWKKYISPYKKQAIIGFFFKMMEALLELLVPLVVAMIIDNGVSHNDTTYIYHMVIRLFLLGLSGYLCALVCQYFASVSSNGFGAGVRKDMYQTINTMDFEQLDNYTTSSLLSRLTNDVNQLQLAVTWTIRLVSRNPVIIIGSIIMSFFIDPTVALVLLLISPFLALSIFLVMKYTQPMYRNINRMLDNISLKTRENLSGVRVIRAFNKQSLEKEKFNDYTNRQKDLQLQSGKLSALMNPLTTVIINIGIILILYVGGLKVNTGTLSKGEVIALVNYMNAILLSMYAFADVILTLIKANASYKRIAEVLDTHPTIKEGTINYIDNYSTLLRFQDVSFSYPSTDVLSHIDFTMNKGETVGIIGGTGSGKSTLIQLIPRFYECSEGNITFKDHLLEDYTFSYLRGCIGYLPQHAQLFTGTVKENLLISNPDASDEDIDYALKLSQSYEFVSKLPEGIETMIHTHSLSGGQKQRLTIARALVRHPELLILDDSASALDFATDAALRKALLNADITTIIVSQRVSSLMHSDKILVLDHGQLSDIGTHKALLQRSPLYKEIYESQIEGDHNA